jgi:uncharacterized repeat protein (TIGR01451 family)
MARYAPTPAYALPQAPAAAPPIFCQNRGMGYNYMIARRRCAEHKQLPKLLHALSLWVLPIAAFWGALCVADTPHPTTLEVRATAAVRQNNALVPADRVVPGDEVFYTLAIRNTGSTGLPAPTVDFQIPEHIRYLANSATGAGAEVSYSVDGGHKFDQPENLKIVATTGDVRLATAADYTHIRWQLKHVLKSKSMALARFRAVVK